MNLATIVVVGIFAAILVGTTIYESKVNPREALNSLAKTLGQITLAGLFGAFYEAFKGTAIMQVAKLAILISMVCYLPVLALKIYRGEMRNLRRVRSQGKRDELMKADHSGESDDSLELSDPLLDPSRGLKMVGIFFACLLAAFVFCFFLSFFVRN